MASLPEPFTQCLTIWIIDRLLTEHRCPLTFSLFCVIPSGNSTVNGNTIVPKCDTPGFPVPPDCQVVGRMKMFAEKVQDMYRFIPFEFGNVYYERRIVE